MSINQFEQINFIRVDKPFGVIVFFDEIFWPSRIMDILVPHHLWRNMKLVFSFHIADS